MVQKLLVCKYLKVQLMPTWRKTVQDMLQRDPEHAAELLAQTDFYRFYNSLIHTLPCCKKCGSWDTAASSCCTR